MQVACWIKEIGLLLTHNAVMHRQNLHQLSRALEMAVDMGARRIEVAIVQFYGCAMLNRNVLMPPRAQAKEAERIVSQAREDLKSTLVIDFVPADYHSDDPKRCMGGWGTTSLSIAPGGQVLPCHAAQIIKHLTFETVREKPLADIWYASDAFNAYRGTDFLPEPCRSCDRREVDFGGCRCQALAVAGDATATDPVCIKSPFNGKMRILAKDFASDADTEITYRKTAG